MRRRHKCSALSCLQKARDKGKWSKEGTKLSASSTQIRHVERIEAQAAFADSVLSMFAGCHHLYSAAAGDQMP